MADDNPPPVHGPARMTSVISTPQFTGNPAEQFRLQFTKPAGSNDWFVYTDGFVPILDYQGRTNASTQSNMKILPLSITGCPDSISRCRVWRKNGPADPYAVVATWTDGAWKMSWTRRAGFKFGYDTAGYGYTVKGSWVSAPEVRLPSRFRLMGRMTRKRNNHIRTLRS